MLSRGRLPRVLAACLLCAWLALFCRAGSTEHSMIRAVLLERGAQGWTAGFLYQAPEASADAAEAKAEVGFAAAQGHTLALALSAAEALLPQSANYRLCDYVLLGPADDAGALLAAYEQAVLDRQCGRLAARVLRCAFSGAELSEQSRETAALPQALLQCAKQTGRAAPRLYERGEGLLLPVLTLTQSGAACADEGMFLLGSRELTLSADQTQAALLLAGRGQSGYTFRTEAGVLELERAVCSLAVRGEGYVLRADCLARPGAAVSAGQRQALTQALTETAQLLWQNGADVLGLRAAALAREADAAAPQPTKNACPQLQADVKIYVFG